MARRLAPLITSAASRPAVRRLAAVALPLLLLLLAYALRVHRIGDQRVWWDEGWSVWVARFAVGDILRETGNDVHPPLYFALLRLWRALSGDSEAGLRLLSANLGLLIVAATYTLGRSMARGLLPAGGARAAGLLAALLLAVSRFAIAWSQEIRMYALATLLGVLAVWAARRFWATGRRRDAAAYVLATVAGLYTLYLFALVWAAVNVAWLLGRLLLLSPSLREGLGEGAGEDPLPNPLSQGEGTRSPSLREGLGEGAGKDPLPNPLPRGEGAGSPSLREGLGEGAGKDALPNPLPRGEGTRSPSLREGLGEGAGGWVGLQLIILVLFLPWAVYAAGGFLSTASATPIRPLDFLHIYWTVLTVGIPVDVAQFNRLTLPALAIFAVAVAALVGAVARQLRRSRQPGPPAARPPSRGRRALVDLAFLLAVLLLPLILVYFISLPRQNFYNPPFNPRYLVIFTPFYSILMGWGVARLAAGGRERGAVGGALAAFLVAVALVGLWPYYPGRLRVDDYPSLASTLRAHRQPGDAVVLYTDTDWPIFAYHYPDPWRGVPHLWAITPALAGDFLSPIWASHDAVWLVTTPYSAGGDPQRHVPAWLAGRATAERAFTYGDMAVTLYTRTPARAAAAGALAPGAPAPRPLAAPLAGGAVTGFSQATRDFHSGDTIHLFLYYTASAAGDITVALRDAAGNDWGATAATLPAAPAGGRQQVDVLVPPDAPSGDYRLALTAAGQTTPFGGVTIHQKDAALLTAADVTITQPLDVPFAGGVRLLGYDLGAGRVRPGETVALTLYWSAGGPLAPAHKVFTHLRGDTFNAASGNFLWGQSDAEPAANTRPTTTWRAGEVIIDSHRIPVAADAPPGPYSLDVGLYEPLAGGRLGVLGADGAIVADHVVLGTIVVE